MFSELSIASTVIVWVHISKFSQEIGNTKLLSVNHSFNVFSSIYIFIDFKLPLSFISHLKLNSSQELCNFMLLSIGFLIIIVGGMLSWSTISISFVSSEE